ncbi:MAG: sigma 54-interacting transcriptional regulator [Planctomycetes bacterium]|nr:sigma 54-interacting transcriptional regulator [Planctomycetota bacterium]
MTARLELPSFLSVGQGRIRPWQDQVLLRHRRGLLVLRELGHEEAARTLRLRVAAPLAFGAVAGLAVSGDRALLLEVPPQGRRLARAPQGQSVAPQVALLAWQLAGAGLAPRELDPHSMWLHGGRLQLSVEPVPGTEAQSAASLGFLLARLAGRRSTSALRAPALAELVWRAVGADGAAKSMIRAALSPLPDAAALEALCATGLSLAAEGGLPVVIPAPDGASARGLGALACAAALQSRRHLLPEGLDADGAVALRTFDDLDQAEHWLSRVRGPALCVLQAEPDEAETRLAHSARVLRWPAPGRAALAAWLRPLHAAPELVAERLLPLLERNAFGARRLVLALLETAGAQLSAGTPAITVSWHDELAAMSAARGVNVIHPSASRLALYLSLSPHGLAAEAVDGNRELGRAAEVLAATGLAARRGSLWVPLGAMPAADVDAAGRRAACEWLAGREHFCPHPPGLRRSGWLLALRLRGGDLGAWQDTGGERLFLELTQARLHADALALCEAHAAGCARFGAGPPDVAVLLAARDLASAYWSPRRARRLLRLWARGYQGPWLALLLALRAQVERQLAGPEQWMPLVDRVRSLAPGLARLPREQALLAAAIACCFENPGTALELLRGVGEEPAQSARLLGRARALYVRAHCAFVAIQSAECLDLLQQAREALHPRGYAPLLARWEGEVEAMLVNAHGVATFFARGVDESLQSLRALHQRHGCLQDIVSRAVVNQYLFRLRLREIGSLDAADVETVLAEARPDNRRGYLIVLYQLSENAAYRGDTAIVRQLGARMQALQAVGVSPMAWAGWVRHNALRLALAGDFAGALRWWRQAGVWRLPEPWRSRMNHLRLGERGLLRLLAGKFGPARRDLHRATEALVAMSAGGRATGFHSVSVALGLLESIRPTGEELEDLQTMGSRGYHLPRLVASLAQCHESADWQPLAAVAEDDPAPVLWRSMVLAWGAMLASRRAGRQAAQLAQAALALVPTDAPLLRTWLERQFPPAARPAAPADPGLLAALAAMTADPLQPPTAAQLAQLAVEQLASLCRADAGCLIEEVGGGMTGNPALRETCEQALAQGESIDPQACAVSLRSTRAALAVAAGPEVVATLAAVAARLDELLAVSAARIERDQNRRRLRALAAAGWILGESTGFGQRLGGLAALIAAEAGADAVELALMRRGRAVLATSRVAEHRWEWARRVDDVLELRLRAGGGARDVLERAVDAAALALAESLRRAPEALRAELGRAQAGEVAFAAGEPLGGSPAALRLAETITRFADLDLTVVITGPPGSGKDLAARALHQAGARARLPHVVVDCATLRPETAASELFGHVRGAFTGAGADHVGLLQAAGRGTVQLDNPAELPGAIQAMLLRALQQRRFLPVGGLSERDLHARIVVTSEISPDELAAQGRLRPDLAQRLSGLGLHLPPLAERGEDAVFLARHFARETGRELGRPARLSRPAEAWVAAQAWPGNVRELRSAVARAVVMCQGGQITPEDLRSADADQAASLLRLPPGMPGVAMAGRLVLAVLRELGDAAPQDLVRRLGLSRTTVSTALSELARRGLAQRRGRGRATRYAPAG